MKSVLRSIKPYWFYLICEGKKTIEVGKDCPKATDWNRTVELYCSKDMESFNRIPKEYQEKYRKYLGKVGAKFICDYIKEYTSNERGWYCYDLETCLLCDEIAGYGKGKTLYGWHISDLQIYDKPKTLNEFTRPCSYDGICFSCKRFIANGMPPYGFCDSTITRPPQSYMFVEEL